MGTRLAQYLYHAILAEHLFKCYFLSGLLKYISSKQKKCFIICKRDLDQENPVSSEITFEVLCLKEKPPKTGNAIIQDAFALEEVGEVQLGQLKNNNADL